MMLKTYDVTYRYEQIPNEEYTNEVEALNEEHAKAIIDSWFSDPDMVAIIVSCSEKSKESGVAF